MAYESVEADTWLTVDQVATVFRRAIRTMDPDARFGPVDIAEGQPDVYAAFAAGKNLITRWCIQLFVREDDDSRRVQVIILGSSILGKVAQGTRNTYSAAVGRARAGGVIAAIREAERQLGEAS
ncbi:MAG TPA: hypothetical protein VK020_11840 [Microlunatus sp.]|nr:hypothetical protein [Microlunatus sp.]